MVSSVCIIIPTILSNLYHLLSPSWDVLFFSSTICYLQKWWLGHMHWYVTHLQMFESWGWQPWILYPNCWTTPQWTHQRHLFMIKNWSSIFWFQDYSNYHMWRKPNSYGTFLLVYQILMIILKNLLQYMTLWSQNGSPLSMEISVVYHQ